MSALRPFCFSCRSLLCRVCPPLLVTSRITGDPASFGRPGRKQRSCAVPKRPTTLSPEEKGERRDQWRRGEGGQSSCALQSPPRSTEANALCLCARGLMVGVWASVGTESVCPVILSSLLSHANINEGKSCCRGANKSKKTKPTFAADLVLVFAFPFQSMKGQKVKWQICQIEIRHE